MKWKKPARKWQSLVVGPVYAEVVGGQAAVFIRVAPTSRPTAEHIFLLMGPESIRIGEICLLLFFLFFFFFSLHFSPLSVKGHHCYSC